MARVRSGRAPHCAVVRDLFSIALGTILISSEEGETDGELVAVVIPTAVTPIVHLCRQPATDSV